MKKNIKIVCAADFHSMLDVSIPEVDLLLIAGDLCPAYHDFLTSIDMQKDWLNCEFRNWLKRQPVKNVVICPGNHDWIFERDINKVPDFGENVHCLIDASIELFGLKIYVTPWQLSFCDWAFNLPEERLKLYWDNIPEDTDVLLCHSPPYGILDKEIRNGHHIGSKTLLDRVMDIRPKAVIFGHNHNENGIVMKEGIRFVNCSLVDEEYIMSKQPIYLEIEK